MDTRNPCTGHSAGARKSITADPSSPSRIPPKRQREPFKIAIIRGLWRGCDITITPPASGYSPRHCRDYAEAMAVAEELARVTGWRVEDRVGGDG